MVPYLKNGTVPRALNLSGFMRNSTTSCSSCFASSHPFTSSKVTSTHTKILSSHQCCGAGSISQRNGSGSGSFYHQAKIVGKTLIPIVWWLLFDFLSLKNNVNVSKAISRKTFFLKFFLLASWRSMTKIAGSGSESGSISQRNGSVDPDPNPHQNAMDPQHCFSRKNTVGIFWLTIVKAREP